MQKTASFLAIAVSMMLMHPVEGWDTLQESVEGSCCGETPHPMRVTARHIEANGIGYNQGYTTVEGFFPLYDAYDSWISFLDARVHVFNDGQPAANGGLGFRFLTDSRVWGANLYYDYRKTSRHHYNQVAAGLEWLGQKWDFRLNGYLPVGKKRSHFYETQFHEFKGHEAILRSKYQYALAGANAEVGYHVNRWENYPLYLDLGPYYLTGKGGTAWGGQFRARLQIYDYLTIEANTSYDNLFKWIGQGQVGVTVPFGPRKTVRKNKCQSDCSKPLAFAARFYQPVDRFEIISVDTKHKHSVAIDPLTGNPWFFVFVNNTSHSAGTFESPYPTLAEAEANSVPHNVIYVFPGDGTTTGMDQGITLQDFQKLWGSGVAQTLPTTRGKVTVPQMSNGTLLGSTVLPNITNTVGDVVTLANNNEISGLFLQNQGMNNCISGTTVTNLNVLNSTLAGINAPGFIGISVTDIAGTVNVSGCTFNQGSNAINLVSSSNNTTFLLANNQIDSFNPTISSAVYWALSNEIEGTLIAENNTIVSGLAGIFVDVSDTSAILAQINNNRFNTGEYGVFIENLTSSPIGMDVTLQNNTMNTVNQCVYLSQPGSLSAVLQGNTMISSGTPFELDTFLGTTGSILFENNHIISSAPGNFIYLSHQGGDLVVTFNNNLIETGIFSFISPGNQILMMSGNTMKQNQVGLSIELIAGSFTGTITDNTISGSSSAINFQQSAGISNITIAGNRVSGFDFGIEASQGIGSLTATITDNIVTAVDSSAEAIFFSQTSGPLTTTMTGNTIIANKGIDVSLTTGPYIATINDNTITAAEAILIQGTEGPYTATMNNNTIDANTAMILTVDTGPFNIAMTGNIITSKAGIQIGGGGASTGIYNVTMNNNTIGASNGPSNVQALFLGINNSTASLSMTGNQLTGGINGAYGLLLESNNSTLNVSLVDNIVTGFGLIDLELTGGTGITNLAMTGNTLQGVSPLLIDLTDGTLNAAIQGNRLVATTANGFNLNTMGTTPSVMLDMTGNTMTSVGASAISISSALTTMNANIANNTLNGIAFSILNNFMGGTYLINLQSNIVPNGGGFSLNSSGDNVTWNVNDNNFTALNSSPVAATLTGGNACMQLNNNTAYPIPNAYVLTNSGGINFLLNPPQNNIGEIVPTGITIMPCP